jgi:hypothetical protein
MYKLALALAVLASPAGAGLPFRIKPVPLIVKLS